LGVLAEPPFCADENILEIFSAVNAGTDDKELLFSFLRHMPGTAREVSRFLKGEHRKCVGTTCTWTQS
jgi:hypothetical protein